MLGEFENKTGDPVFDGILRQGLSVQLEQSPFLTLVSDQQIQQVLRFMGRPPETRLTPEVAQEICERTGGTAVLEGSISSLGNQYVVWLRARNCGTGDVLGQEQVQAERKEDVLNALTRIAVQIRARLGESLSSIEEHSTPLEQATTASLEALKAYSAATERRVRPWFRCRDPPSSARHRHRSSIRHGASRSWGSFTGTWDKPIWAPSIPGKPMSCGIASATGKGSLSSFCMTGR